MEKLIGLQVISPEKELFKGKVSKVTLPGSAGRFTVLYNHAPLISSLSKGVILFTENPHGTPNESIEHIISIKRGFAEIEHNQMTICIETEESENKK